MSHRTYDIMHCCTVQVLRPCGRQDKIGRPRHQGAQRRLVAQSGAGRRVVRSLGRSVGLPVCLPVCLSDFYLPVCICPSVGSTYNGDNPRPTRDWLMGCPTIYGWAIAWVLTCWLKGFDSLPLWCVGPLVYWLGHRLVRWLIACSIGRLNGCCVQWLACWFHCLIGW